MNKVDNIYSLYQERVASFVFDEKVVAVFDDMIRRSVPGYGAAIAMTMVFAEQYAQAGSNCYDLGCSLGTSTLAMRKGMTKPDCKIVAVDNSPAMIERCKEIVAQDLRDVPVEVTLGDIQDIEIERASLVVLNYTLQFLPPTARDAMIQKIFDGMLPGGCLLLSEKIAFNDEAEQKFQIDMHHNFKRLNGYSATEISQKRKSIENVLIPDTLNKHRERLEMCGFENITLWFQCFNFMSLAAFKGKDVLQ
ncbi:MAG: carboxy-S-adenosyl-L-methionine synthase CmoA [Sedimentisphaeraceae bacterium JB056]